MRDGDTLIVTKPDRLARSTSDLLRYRRAGWEAKGVGLVVLSMGGQRVDTRTATGKLMLTMLAAVATFERADQKITRMMSCSWRYAAVAA